MNFDRKTHLAASESPIKFKGDAVKAICEAIVPDATRLFIWDDLSVGAKAEVQNRVGNCTKCFGLMKWHGDNKREYLYGIKSGLALRSWEKSGDGEE